MLKFSIKFWYFTCQCVKIQIFYLAMWNFRYAYLAMWNGALWVDLWSCCWQIWVDLGKPLPSTCWSGNICITDLWKGKAELQQRVKLMLLCLENNERAMNVWEATKGDQVYNSPAWLRSHKPQPNSWQALIITKITNSWPALKPKSREAKQPRACQLYNSWSAKQQKAWQPWLFILWLLAEIKRSKDY